MLSYRKLAMRVLGRPLHTGGIDSPRPASQRAAAFILTAVMLTTLAAPAFAGTWSIENGDITVKAGETGNDVTQNNVTTKNDTDTIITNSDKDTASSHTVTIETNDKNDKVEVTLDNVNIKADSGSALTSKGDVTLTLKGDNSLTGGNGGSGISSSGSLTISGGENNSLTAQGGSGSGIFSSGGVTISGGTVNATGGSSSGGSDSGDGIHSGSLTISGGTVTATGGSGADGSGGSGIRTFSSGGVTISGGTVNATGGTGGTGENSNGGSGIYIYSSSGSLTVSGGTVTANGGSGGGNGGDGISSTNTTISGGSTVTANGGNGGSLVGGDGIRSGGGLTVSDGTVTAKGGNGDSKDGYGGDGIRSGGVVTISGNTVNAAGGNGSTGGGSGIYSSVIDLSGSLELTAKAGSPNGKALSQNGSELVLDTIKDKLGPGAKVTATDADGKVIDQVSTPRPVEPEESSSSSDGGSSAPSAPASPLPGLTVTDKDGQRISYTSTQSGNTLTVCVGRLTASFRISLAALRQLRAEGIETIAFQTVLCSTTLSVDELLAMGGEDAEAVLTHRFTDSSLTVG